MSDFTGVLASQGLTYINAGEPRRASTQTCPRATASTARFDRDLELAVLSGLEVHALPFPCRLIPGGWMKSLASLASFDH